MIQILCKHCSLVILLAFTVSACSNSMGGPSGASGTRKSTEVDKKNKGSQTPSDLDASNQQENNISENMKESSQDADKKPSSSAGSNVLPTAQTQTNSPNNTNNNTPPNNTPGVNSSSPFQACTSNGSNVANQPILAKVYQLTEGIQSIAAQPWTPSMYKTKICMPNFNISPRSFDLGFPGLPGLFEWFGLDARAKIVIPSAGQYKFRLLSDDGAILYIDKIQIINHDNQHGPSSKEGTVSLTAGTHDLKILYFQGPRHHIALQLFWTPPSMSEVVVPSSVFKFSDF